MQSSATMSEVEKLEWQAELDSALADIDTRLRHPRGKPPDRSQPSLPELGRIDLSREMLDEIALKVAEHLRKAQVVPPDAAEPARPAAAAPRPLRPALLPRPFDPHASGLRNSAIVSIRFRWPLFRLPRFLRRKRKRHPLSTVKASA